VAVDDASLTAADKALASRAATLLRDRGVSTAMPSSLGSGSWLRPPRRRDNKSVGLRFGQLDRNIGKSYRDGEFDYSVCGWLDAAKLFLATTAHKFASADVFAWDMTALIGAMERNVCVLRPLAERASMSVDGLMTAMREVRNADAHMTGIPRSDFNRCMGTVIQLATRCGEWPSSSLVTELMDMRDSPQSFSVQQPTEAPFPSFIQPEDELYVGHDDVIARLIALLRRGSSAPAGASAGAGASGGGAGVSYCCDTTVTFQAISGLGGVGKSATARELCRRLRDVLYYRRGIFWIVGESVGAFQRGYHDVAKRLELRFDPAVENDARDAVFRWMRSCDRWLLVLDNVDAPSSVKDFMPPSDARGHVVITTRGGAHLLRECGVLRHRHGEPVVLDCLGSDASVSLLYQLCRCEVEALSEDERAAAAQLCVDDLGGLPLAIEQAAAYMRGHDMSVVEYLRLYRARRQALFGVEAAMSAAELATEWQDWLRARGVDDAAISALRGCGVRTLNDLSQRREDCMRAVSSLPPMVQTTLRQALSSGDGVPVAEERSRRSVRTTWELSVRSLSAVHREMVWLLCNFGAEGIPVDAVVACVAELPSTSELRRLLFEHCRTGSAAKVDEADTAVATSACIDVLRGLSERSLVKWEPSSALVSMHRLLQTVVWESATADEQRAVVVACAVGMANGLAPLVKLVTSSGLACDKATLAAAW
jgi:hypothetical protein